MASLRLKSLLFFAFLCASFLFAQSPKQINKSIKIFFDKSYDTGINKLVKYIYEGKYGPTIDGYDTWAQLEYIRYKRDKENFDELEITDIEFFAEKSELDSNDYAEFEEIKNFPEKYFVDICRRITIESTSTYADLYLRMLKIDFDPDSAASDETKEYIEKADEALNEEFYNKAELNYRKALDLDSANYNAILGLGYTFMGKEDYDSAMVFFTMAKNMQPDLIEPRLKIIDALFYQELYYRAKTECLETIIMYPGFDVKRRYQLVLSKENKYMEEHRFLRGCYPNKMGVDQEDAYGIWDEYRSAKKKISKYCDENGIIEENGDTDEKYLEVYSFKRLLTNIDGEIPQYLKFGYKMMEEGYLEPYLFISMFHYDLYPQFKHYISFEENRTKAKEYIEKYLIEKRS